MPVSMVPAPGVMRSAAIALRGWSVHRYAAAGAFAVVVAFLIGIPTVLIPNPVFSREIAVVPWNYPVWIATSVLSVMLAATYAIKFGLTVDDLADTWAPYLTMAEALRIAAGLFRSNLPTSCCA